MDESLIISIAAFCFSAITYIVHDRKIKKQEGQINAYHLEKIEEEKTELKKASVIANLIRGRQGHHRLVIYNSGKCAALNIAFKLLSEDQNFTILDSDIFPFELLNPQENTELTLITHEGSPNTIKIRLIWDDNSGVNNQHEQMLTL